jgi:hypothetical protein
MKLVGSLAVIFKLGLAGANAAGAAAKVEPSTPASAIPTKTSTRAGLMDED